MSGIVLELQQDILNTNCDILNILRKAHVIAKKLSLNEFDAWILSELNGYKDFNTIPDYRIVRGILKAKDEYSGWISVSVSDNETEKQICSHKMNGPLGEIIQLEIKSQSEFLVYYSARNNLALNAMFSVNGNMRFALHVSAHHLKTIIEGVKNTLLEWTLKLESEGIIGEDMRFSSNEIESAKNIPQTVNNYYLGNTNVINAAEVNNSAIIAGNNNSVEFTYEKAEKAVAEIETSLEKEKLSSDNRETAEEMIKETKDKIIQKKKPSVIKATLVALKDFLVGVGASATVAVIQAKMQGLF